MSGVLDLSLFSFWQGLERHCPKKMAQPTKTFVIKKFHDPTRQTMMVARLPKVSGAQP